jgi:hypothetical protein
MWTEAETNSKENGCKSEPNVNPRLAHLMTSCGPDLGRTTALHDPSDTEGMTLIWLSYWKSLEGLHTFSTSAAHRVGEVNYHKNNYEYLGIMHETFHAPKGSWETMNFNMPPWGLG